jgi:hypothetical protein
MAKNDDFELDFDFEKEYGLSSEEILALEYDENEDFDIDLLSGNQAVGRAVTLRSAGLKYRLRRTLAHCDRIARFSPAHTEHHRAQDQKKRRQHQCDFFISGQLTHISTPRVLLTLSYQILHASAITPLLSGIRNRNSSTTSGIYPSLQGPMQSVLSASGLFFINQAKVVSCIINFYFLSFFAYMHEANSYFDPSRFFLRLF